jgi:hypothetical protein
MCPHGGYTYCTTFYTTVYWERIFYSCNFSA